MTTYATGNPLGSKDPRDLYDNAENFDTAMNDRMNTTWNDRFGVLRPTMKGYEEQFNDWLNAQGYEPVPLVYVDGSPLTVDRSTQLIERDGILYSVKRPASFPLELTGNWSTDQSLLVLQVDQGFPEEIGRGVRRVDSVNQLRTISGRFMGDMASLVGYYSDYPGIGGGGLYWDAFSSDADDGFTMFAVDGVPVGRWIRSDIGSLNVHHAGAIHGQESSDAIQRAIDWVRARGYGTVDLGGSGFFLISKPLRGCERLRIIGKGEIRAKAPFENVTFDVFGGGTAEVGTLIYFVDTPPTSTSGTVGTIGNTSGSRRTNVQIEQTVTLDCDDVAAYAIFMDNYQYFDLAPRITDPTKWGIRLYIYGWTGSISAKITGAAEGGLWLGGGCNGINLDGLMVWGASKTTSIAGVLVDGDNNGISFAGATIEKCYDGILLRNGFGPINISGVDFEQIERHPINADGSAVPGRINGPVNVTANFLETNSLTDALIRGVNVDINVIGNRLRKATSIYNHAGSGMVVEHNNVVEATVLANGTGVFNRVRRGGRALIDEFFSAVSNAMATVREIVNYSYPYAGLASSGLTFAHQITSAANRTMVSLSTWYVANFTLDSESGRMGLNLDYSTGAKAVTPLVDNDQDLGSASRRNKTVWAGTGAISTSDAREKTPVVAMSANQIAAAKAIAKEIGTYKWLKMVEEKGDSARIHVGMTVQRAIEIMTEHGLDPMDYGFICFDQWEEQPEQVDEDGNVVIPASPSGDRYSFRYDELNMFIAAGFEERLSLLEGK